MNFLDIYGLKAQRKGNAMNPDSMDAIMNDVLDSFMSGATSVVAEAIVLACIAQANGPAVDAQAMFRAAKDKEAVKTWERGTDVEKGIARAFSTAADTIGCEIDAIEMFADAGVSHRLIESGISNYVLMVHVRNGFTVLRPDGSRVNGVLPNGENVDLGKL